MKNTSLITFDEINWKFKQNLINYAMGWYENNLTSIWLKHDAWNNKQMPECKPNPNW